MSKSSTKALLNSVVVNDVKYLYKGKVITIEVEATAEEALETLMKNHISSAPLLDNGKIVGVVDVKDFATAILKVIGNQNDQSPRLAHRSSGVDLRKNLARKSLFSHLASKKITDTKRTTLLKTVKSGTPLVEVIGILANHGCHRVLVVDDGGAIVGLVTQSAVLQYIHAHLDSCPELEKVLIGDNGIFQRRKIVTLSHDLTGKEAYEMMLSSNVTAAPILDKKGLILGNLSFSDLKGFGSKYSVESLMLPLPQFYNTVRKAFTSDTKFPCVYCGSKKPVANVIRKLTSTRIHRIYVCKDFKPIGVLTLTSLMQILDALCKK